jgi:hypothetical protein
MQGLRQKILAATSEVEVTQLLEAGKKFEFASRKMVNSWKSAARRALKQKPAAPTEVVEEVEAPKKNRKRKK